MQCAWIWLYSSCWSLICSTYINCVIIYHCSEHFDCARATASFICFSARALASEIKKTFNMENYMQCWYLIKWKAKLWSSSYLQLGHHLLFSFLIQIHPLLHQNFPPLHQRAREMDQFYTEERFIKSLS